MIKERKKDMTVKECYDAMGADYEDVMRRLRTDERVKKFLLKILDDKTFQLLNQSMEEKNMDEAFRAAHTLKGVCQNLSLTRLYGSSNQLSEQLRENREYSQKVEELVAQVKEDYDITIASITGLKE